MTKENWLIFLKNIEAACKKEFPTIETFMYDRTEGTITKDLVITSKGKIPMSIIVTCRDRKKGQKQIYVTLGDSPNDIIGEWLPVGAYAANCPNIEDNLKYIVKIIIAVLR